ncbi:MAG: type II secretion system secretin GspD [Burkholderiaceae bacterium]
MERTLPSLHRLHARALAAALLAASLAPVQAASHAAAAQAAAGEDAVPTARARNTPVTLNFVNADIEAVSRAIGAMLNRDILVDPRVKGTITVYNDKPQPLSDAYRSYLAALRGLGFTVVEAGGFLKVVPEADAKLQTGVVSVGTPARSGDQVLTQIFKLQHENPNNLVAVLRPLITANNTINASPGSNSLVITDYADNLQRLGRIIEALDQPSGSELEVVPLKNAVASDIVQLVQKLVDGGAVQTPGVPGQTAQTSILVDPRTNSLIIRAANATRMAQARMIVDKLDQPTAGGGPAGNIWVVYLKNADATKIAEVLRAAIASGSVGGGSGGAGGSSGGSNTQGSAFGSGNRDSTTTSSSMTSSSGTTGSNGASPQSTNPVSASAHPSTGGQVQADPATNSLIITASEPLYRQMRQVIDQLDVRRAQVYVEALMVTMDETKAAQMGFQWQNLFGRKGDSTLTGAGTNFGSQSTLNNILTGSASLIKGTSGVSSTAQTLVGSGTNAISNGLNIGIVKNLGSYYTLGALAQFLETNTGANVLATPNLIAMDNEEAKIVVGQNIPLVTGSYTNTGSSSSSVNPFQTVERQDVGITLRIKSSIGENGTVRMTIYEENSSVAPGTGGQTTNKTSYEGYVTVDDGSMIVLGGLISDDYNDEVDQVPLLGNIPLIGNLFKSQNRTRSKRNLMLFLRPVVMRSQSDADAITLNRYDAIRRQQETTQPDKNIVLRVNDAPVVPRIGADTRVLPTPQDSQEGSVKMQNVDPLPDLHRPGAIYGPAGAQPLPQQQAPQPTFVPLGQMTPVAPQPGSSTTTTTTTTTVAPAPAASVPTK